MNQKCAFPPSGGNNFLQIWKIQDLNQDSNILIVFFLLPKTLYVYLHYVFLVSTNTMIAEFNFGIFFDFNLLFMLRNNSNLRTDERQFCQNNNPPPHSLLPIWSTCLLTLLGIWLCNPKCLVYIVHRTLHNIIISSPLYHRFIRISSELGTFEWWISRLMLNPLFFLIARLNNACSYLVINLQIN